MGVERGGESGGEIQWGEERKEKSERMREGK
jgi:hypothetical protein